MGDDAATVDQLRAELRRLREAHAIEIAALRAERAHDDQALAESQEQQTATAGVLRIIASSPTDLQAVLNTSAENAARLVDAHNVRIHQSDGGEYLRIVAHYGPIGESTSVPRRGTRIDRDSPPRETRD